MIKTLIYKDVKSIIKTFQFQFLVVTSIVTCLLLLVIGLIRYNDNFENYSTLQLLNTEHINSINVFSELQPVTCMKPNALSIICTGSAFRQGIYNTISPFSIPYVVKDSFDENNYMVDLFHFDFNKVVSIILSLLVILISFNLISQENEKGTLKLLLSNYIPRWKIILSKIISTQLAVTLALLVIFILVLIVFSISSYVEFSLETLGRLGLIFVYYELYLFLFVLIGSVLSIVIKRSSIALIIALFIWLLNTIVVPISIDFIMQSDNTARELNVKEMIKEVNIKTNQDIDKWVKNNPKPLPSYTYGYVNFDEKNNYFIARGIRDEFINWNIDYFTYRNNRKIESTQQIVNLRKLQVLEEHNNYKRRKLVGFLSLTNMLNLAIDNLCNTSGDDILNYFESVEDYRLSVIRYLKGKNAFKSRKWFTDDPLGTEPWVTDPLNFNKNELINSPGFGYKVYLALNVNENQAKRMISLTDFPYFNVRNISMARSFRNSFMTTVVFFILISLLLFINILLFNKYYIIE